MVGCVVRAPLDALLNIFTMSLVESGRAPGLLSRAWSGVLCKSRARFDTDWFKSLRPSVSRFGNGMDVGAALLVLLREKLRFGTR